MGIESKLYNLSTVGRDWGRTKRFCAESYLTFQTRRFQVALQLWDTAGQERFRSMAPMYYRGAAAAIIVFDTTKDRAWNTIKAWHKVSRNIHAQHAASVQFHRT